MILRRAADLGAGDMVRLDGADWSVELVVQDEQDQVVRVHVTYGRSSMILALVPEDRVNITGSATR